MAGQVSASTMSPAQVPPYPAELAATPTTVALTGCAGYVAGAIVARLLQLGHTVHGTCRDPAKAEMFKALPGASDRLKLFKADLTEPGSFDKAFEGCTYVIHCASPYIVINGSAQQVRERLLKPAIQGTENVLGSVNKTPSIKRVVLTSSCAAIYGSAIERGAGHVFTEADWSIVPSETILTYSYSKREAEKRAWAIAEEQKRWDLVVINPSAVFGPPVTGRPDGTSLEIFQKAFNGELSIPPDMGLPNVDIRDVAAAHTLALFTASAKGRYVCSAQTTRLADVPRILSEVYPGQVKAPTMTLPKWLFWLVGPLAGVSRADVTHSANMPGPNFSHTKIQEELGLKFIDMKTMLKDQGDAMLEFGLIKLKKK